MAVVWTESKEVEYTGDRSPEILNNMHLVESNLWLLTANVVTVLVNTEEELIRGASAAGTGSS